MKKILFVTNRNILTTCGELRLIKNRAEVLYTKYGVSSDFIAFSSKFRIQAEKKEIIEAGGKVDVYELAMNNPMKTFSSYNSIKREIETRVESGEYCAVVLSGLAMAFFAKSIRKYSNIKIVLDIHGAQEDILEVSKNSNFVKKVIFRFLYLLERMALKNNFQLVNGCFVVTNALEKYLRERYKMEAQSVFYTVPCATSTDLIDENEYKLNRKVYRNKYGIEDEIVFVYSGGISSWQCVDETIDLYKSIAEMIDCKSRMIIFSHNIKSIRSKIENDDRFIIDSYSPDELSKALCVGDYAFLLRKDCLTNNVAFPNKFLEYVQSRMKIITTPYVHEITNQVVTNDLGYVYSFEHDLTEISRYIINHRECRNCIEKVNEVLVNNSFERCLKSFAEDLYNDEK